MYVTLDIHVGLFFMRDNLMSIIFSKQRRQRAVCNFFFVNSFDDLWDGNYLAGSYKQSYLREARRKFNDKFM